MFRLPLSLSAHSSTSIKVAVCGPSIQSEWRPSHGLRPLDRHPHIAALGRVLGIRHELGCGRAGPSSFTPDRVPPGDRVAHDEPVAEVTSQGSPEQRQSAVRGLNLCGDDLAVAVRRVCPAGRFHRVGAWARVVLAEKLSLDEAGSVLCGIKRGLVGVARCAPRDEGNSQNQAGGLSILVSPRYPLGRKALRAVPPRSGTRGDAVATATCRLLRETTTRPSLPTGDGDSPSEV